MSRNLVNVSSSFELSLLYKMRLLNFPSYMHAIVWSGYSMHISNYSTRY